MLIFDPSKMKFFKKDGEEGVAEKDGEVKTFFDTLNLKGGGGGKSEEEELTEEEKEAAKKKKEEEEEEEEKTLSPEMVAMQEQLKTSQDQTAKLMAIIEKKEKPEEDEQMENPFENDSFDNLAKAMDWDDDEKKAMKAFMQNSLDFQSQATLTTATASVTDIVNSSMNQAEKKKAVQKQFFTENPKLKPVKDYVSTVASGILKEYTALGKALNPAEILKEAASRAYKVLGIDPKAKEEDKEDESESDHNPAFPSNKGNSKKRNQKVNKTRNQKMITSMIDL
jgi:hypothetical protein